MPTVRPFLLTIGAHPVPIAQATVRHAATLLAGYAEALRLLARTKPLTPTLILLDLHAAEPGVPELAAPQLAAVLTSRMQAGVLHPAWLIGLAAEPSPELALEAEVAGCHLVLPPPRTDAQQRGMLRLAHTPVPLVVPDRATQAYQLAAERVLEAVQAVQLPVWTADAVRLVLYHLTPYPRLRDQPARRGDATRTARLLRVLGGPRQARQRLHAIAEGWRTRFPLQAEILWQFLDGWQRREIVSHFVRRQLYEDSRIYACIKHLPERIAQELRLAETREDR